MKLSLKVVKDLVAEIATAKNAEAAAKVAPVPETLTDKQKTLKDTMEIHGHHFGCQEATVRGILEVLSDAPKGSFAKKDTSLKNLYPIGSMIVPVANPNSHNYALNEPVLYYGDFRGLRPRGTTGNLLPFEREDWKDAMRLATAEEIKTYVEKIEVQALPHLMELLNRIPEIAEETEEE